MRELPCRVSDCRSEFVAAGEVVVGEDGSVRMRDTGLLAGSGISLLTAVARSVRMASLTLTEALTMATANPARLLGLDRGTLSLGASADLIIFRHHPGELTPLLEQVIVQGRPLTPHHILESA